MSRSRYLIGKPASRFIVVYQARPERRRLSLSRQRLVIGPIWVWWTR